MDYKVIQQKNIREYIIKAAKEIHPDSISVDLLKKLLATVGRSISIEEIISNARYLEEKGYISIKEIKLPVLSKTEFMIRITAVGIDLAEGSIKDAALDMEG